MNLKLNTFIEALAYNFTTDYEQAVSSLLDTFVLDKLFGKGLDNIGCNINCSRDGLSDNDYRIKIRATAIKMSSTGAANDTKQMLSTLFNSSNIIIENVGNANVSIYVGTTTINYVIKNLRQFIEDTLPIGVGLKVVYNIGNSQNFVFSDINDTLPANAGKGFGSLADNTVGGLFNFLWT